VSPSAYRSIVIFTTAVLAFDGAAIVALGLWGGRMLLVSMGLVFLIAAALVLLSRRWYRRRLADIAAAHGELAEEKRHMQRLFGQQ
jgi:membrane protein implicated in regulation of membrane protease activity